MQMSSWLCRKICQSNKKDLQQVKLMSISISKNHVSGSRFDSQILSR